jgi:hypothetical protein
MLKRAIFTATVATTAIALGLGSTAKGALALDDLMFVLNNDSPYEITEFYTSPSGLDDWENNILEGAALSPYDSIQVNMNDQRDVCEYDFLTVLSDGTEVERYNVDLCDLAGGTYTITEEE